MSSHLSPQQISEWMIGNHSGEVEQHLLACPECAAELAHATESIAMFGSAVRDWSGQQMRNLEIHAPSPRRVHFWNTGMFRWQVATASMAALLLAAIPVYRHERREPVPVTVNAGISDEALLRDVETQVSRSVPEPMEPLANLMAGETGTATRRSE